VQVLLAVPVAGGGGCLGFGRGSERKEEGEGIMGRRSPVVGTKGRSRILEMGRPAAGLVSRLGFLPVMAHLWSNDGKGRQGCILS
jgi:hypothetical protein